MAVDRDGRIRGLRARLIADLGAYLQPLTPVPPVTAAMLLTGVYAIPAAEVELLGVATTKVPTGTYRGAGRPEAAYIVERMVDLAARDLGRGPVDLRPRNLIAPDRFPYDNLLGYVYDSGNYGRALERACALIAYERQREEQRLARQEGRLGGIGVSGYVERAGERLPRHAPGLEAHAEFAMPGPVFPFGACAAVVEIARETGEVQVLRLAAVDDAGRVINPLLAEGQVLGATVQGLGQALCEEAI